MLFQGGGAAGASSGGVKASQLAGNGHKSAININANNMSGINPAAAA